MDKFHDLASKTIQKLKDERKTTISQQLDLFGSQLPKFFDHTLVSDFKTFMQSDSRSKVYTDGQVDQLVNTGQFLVQVIKKQKFRNVRRLELIQNNVCQSPLLYFSIGKLNSSCDKTILFYGHFDKEEVKKMETNIGQDNISGPGCVDSSQLFQMLLMINLLQKNEKGHCNMEFMISSDQLANNMDLLEILKNDKNGLMQNNIDMLVNLDTSCKDYNRLWRTSCRKGQIVFDINIQTADDDFYFPESNGVVPTNDRIAMELVMRIRENTVGWIDDSLQTDLTSTRLAEIEKMAQILDNNYTTGYFKMHRDTRLPYQDDFIKQMINNYQRPQLAIYGMSGMNPISCKNNSMFCQKQYGSVGVRLCLQLTPTQDPYQQFQTIKHMILQNPPYNCKLSVNLVNAVQGMSLKINRSNKTNQILDQISRSIFGNQMEIQQESSHCAFTAFINQVNPSADIVCLGYNGPFSFSHCESQNLNLEYFLQSTNAIALLVSQYSLEN